MSTVQNINAKAFKIDNDSKTLVADEGFGYQWYKDGEKLEGQTAQELAGIESGYYVVEVKDEVGNVTIQDATVELTATGAIVHIYTIGDSTVSTYGASEYPRTGWGQVLQHFFTTAIVQVVNKAVSGTSSKSFYNTYWTAVKNALVAGDFVFIQFGHNDSKNTTQDDIDNRYTTPSTTYKQYLTNYVNETKAKGAFPVFVTSMNRNWWKNGAIDPMADYPPAMRELAAALKIPLIDLNSKSAILFNSLGQAYTTNFIFNNLAVGEYTNYPTGNADNTHFQEMGAIDMARLVAQGVSELSADANVKTLIPYLTTQYKITVSVNPTGADSMTTRTATYPTGVPITLKTIPKAKSTFQKWNNASNTSIAVAKLTKITSGSVATSYAAIYKGAVVGTYDCNNIANGIATLDMCDRCVGGTTGKTACTAVDEAETVACSYDGVIETKNTGYKGSSYLNATNAISAGITFQVQANTAGSAILSFRYATSADRPTQLIVNGITQQSVLSFTTTGDFTTWASIDVSVPLVKGNNTVVLSPTTVSGLANIDQIGYVSSGLAKGNCVVTDVNDDTNSSKILELFPNPFKEHFTLSFSGAFSYQVYDYSGKLQEQGGAENYTVLGGKLDKGVYLLKVYKSNTNTVLTQKLIKQ